MKTSTMSDIPELGTVDPAGLFWCHVVTCYIQGYVCVHDVGTYYEALIAYRPAMGLFVQARMTHEFYPAVVPTSAHVKATKGEGCGSEQGERQRGERKRKRARNVEGPWGFIS